MQRLFHHSSGLHGRREAGHHLPDARKDAVTPEFATRWESMARYSFSCYQNLQGLPGHPVEWDTFYGLHSREPSAPHTDPIGFASLDDRIQDIEPQGNLIRINNSRLPYSEVHKKPNLIFNVTGYADYLLRQFLERGGRIKILTLHHPSDLEGSKNRWLMCLGSDFGLLAI